VGEPFTEPAATKRDLIRYYARIAPYRVPYLAAPEWLPRWHNTAADPAKPSATRTSRLPDVHQPTWALIDIDPGAHPLRRHRAELARLDITQNAINKTLSPRSASRPSPPRQSRDHLGRTRRPAPAPEPLDHPHPPRVRDAGDPRSPELIGWPQDLPPL